jgi:sugar O-acyltransferase (sialic acid O-acetyltransferase NeuD family)
MSARIGILGNGGHAREIESYLGTETVAFRAVGASYRSGDLIDIAAPGAEHAELPVVAGVGAPGLRRTLVQLWPGSSYHGVVAPTAYIGPEVTLGAGCVIAPGAVLTTSITLGDHVHVNVGATLAHDTVVGDFTTISPGANLGGNCTLGAGVVIGIGAILREGITLADGVVVGAGAVVLRDVLEPNSVVVGNPARHLSTNADWASAF